MANYPLFIFSALCGVAAVIYFSKAFAVFNKFVLLEKIGKSSLYVFGLHLCIINICYNYLEISVAPLSVLLIVTISIIIPYIVGMGLQKLHI